MTGTDTIDFGASPVSGGTFLITAGVSGLTSASYLEAFFMKESTGSNTIDDHEMAGSLIELICEFVSATSFNIIARCDDDMLVQGTFSVRWVSA